MRQWVRQVLVLFTCWRTTSHFFFARFKCGHSEIWEGRVVDLKLTFTCVIELKQSMIRFKKVCFFKLDRHGEDFFFFFFFILLIIFVCIQIQCNRGRVSRHVFWRRSVDRTPTCVIHCLLTLGFLYCCIWTSTCPHDVLNAHYDDGGGQSPPPAVVRWEKKERWRDAWCVRLSVNIVFFSSLTILF